MRNNKGAGSIWLRVEDNGFGWGGLPRTVCELCWMFLMFVERFEQASEHAALCCVGQEQSRL